MKRTVILCGFMACGKTTVGRELASVCKCEFFDSDLYVENQQNMTVADIFKSFGEDRFRQLEHEAISDLLRKSPCVISLGGGAVMFKRNTDIIKNSRAMLVFIDTPFALISERLQGDVSRPLAADKEKLRALYTKRYPFYKAAADIVITADKDPAQTAKDIMSHLISEEK